MLKERYFIVERDALTYWGSEDGLTKAQAKEMLAACRDDDVVVIKGVIISTKVVIVTELELED